MTNLIEKLKNKKYLILTLIFLLSIIFIASKIDIKRDDNKNVKNNFEANKISYGNLTLGEAERNDIIKEIGNPDNEYTNNQKTIIEYKTLNPNYNDQYALEDNKLKFIKKIVTINEKIKVSDLKEKYGKEEVILYGPGSSIGLYLYVYLSKGIAFLGHQKSNTVNEIWYFLPTDKENFILRYATEYSEKENKIQ